MDGELFRHAAAKGVFLYDPPNLDTVERPACARDKERVFAVTFIQFCATGIGVF